METCDQEPCTQPTTTTTTNTSAFNDTSRHTGVKNWIQQVLLWLSSSFPINYTCYQYTAVGKYCTLCVQMLDGASWHEAPWKQGLFTFWLWSRHCIQLAFTSKSVIQIYIFWARLMAFKKWILFKCHNLNNTPIRPSKSLLKSPSGGGEKCSSRPNISWKTQSDWLIFLSKEIPLADTESTGLINPVLSESTESLDNVQLTICTPVL